MWTKQKRRTNKTRFTLPIFTSIVVAYFSYHIYHGEYGLESREIVEQRIIALNSQYKELLAQNTLMKKHISLLRDGSLEKDTLDEYARRDLNLSKPNELTIITAPEDKH